MYPMGMSIHSGIAGLKNVIVCGFSIMGILNATKHPNKTEAKNLFSLSGLEVQLFILLILLALLIPDLHNAKCLLILIGKAN